MYNRVRFDCARPFGIGPDDGGRTIVCSGKTFNTIHTSDYSFYWHLNDAYALNRITTTSRRVPVCNRSDRAPAPKEKRSEASAFGRFRVWMPIAAEARFAPREVTTLPYVRAPRRCINRPTESSAARGCNEETAEDKERIPAGCVDAHRACAIYHASSTGRRNWYAPAPAIAATMSTSPMGGSTGTGLAG